MKITKQKASSIFFKTMGVIFILNAILIAFNIAHLNKLGQIIDEAMIGVCCLLAEVDYKKEKDKDE